MDMFGADEPLMVDIRRRVTLSVFDRSSQPGGAGSGASGVSYSTSATQTDALLLDEEDEVQLLSSCDNGLTRREQETEILLARFNSRSG